MELCSFVVLYPANSQDVPRKEDIGKVVAKCRLSAFQDLRGLRSRSKVAYVPMTNHRPVMTGQLTERCPPPGGRGSLSGDAGSRARVLAAASEASAAGEGKLPHLDSNQKPFD